MSFITVPAQYSNGIIKTLEKVKKNPVRVMVTFEYLEENKENTYKERIDDFNSGKDIYNENDLDLLMKKRGVIK